MRTITTKLFALASLGAFTTLAQAQLTIGGTGPFDSVGAPGDPGNFSANVANPLASTVYGNFSFTGILNSVISGTYVQDSDWDVRNTTMNGGFFVEGVGTDPYTSQLVSINRGGLYWINQNDNLYFESSENFDDGAGADANWTDVTFQWSNAATITDIGTYNLGTSFLLDTNGSDFDTMIALYTSTGQFLGSDDDGGTGLQSLLNGGTLGVGTYYFVATGYLGQFDNGVAMAGEDFGNLMMNVNGTNHFTGAHDTNNVHTLSFTVTDPVPEPASLAVLGLGALALLRRRRAK